MFYDTKFHSVSITLIVTFQSSSVADTAYIIFYLSLSLALLQLVFQSSPSSSQLMDSLPRAALLYSSESRSFWVRKPVIKET